VPITESSRRREIDLIENAFPVAVSGPEPEPFVRGLSRPVPLGQISPGSAGAQSPQDRVEHLPVIAPPLPTGFDRRQQRLDPGQGLVGQLTVPYHPAMINRRRSEPLQDAS
jgi:hypothetical protein